VSGWCGYLLRLWRPSTLAHDDIAIALNLKRARGLRSMDDLACGCRCLECFMLLYTSSSENAARSSLTLPRGVTLSVLIVKVPVNYQICPPILRLVHRTILHRMPSTPSSSTGLHPLALFTCPSPLQRHTFQGREFLPLVPWSQQPVVRIIKLQILQPASPILM